MFQHALVRSFSIRNTMHMLSNRNLGMFVMLNKMKTSNFFSWNYSVTNWLSQKTIHLSKINKEILSMALLSSACSLLYCLCDWLFIAIVLDYTHGFVIGPVINHSLILCVMILPKAYNINGKFPNFLQCLMRRGQQVLSSICNYRPKLILHHHTHTATNESGL